MTAAAEPTTKVKAGEVWKIHHERKGDLTVRFDADADFAADGFVDVEIVEGTARFMSDAYRLAQKLEGLGTSGTILPIRTTLTALLERVQPAA